VIICSVNLKSKIPMEILNKKSKILNCKNGFSIIEVLVSVAILSFILLVIISFIFSMNISNTKTKADREVGENARRVLDEMTYEIRSAKSIYTPTTTQNQISLETFRYLPTGENTTYIDFFLCGFAICLKKESQNPIALTPDSVQVTNLTFSQVLNNTIPSIKINITVNYPGNDINSSSSINLTSTASLRSY